MYRKVNKIVVCFEENSSQICGNSRVGVLDYEVIRFVRIYSKGDVTLLWFEISLSCTWVSRIGSIQVCVKTWIWVWHTNYKDCRSLTAKCTVKNVRLGDIT
jgi:hypothetical protein